MASSVLPQDSSTTWHLCWQAALGREIFVDAGLYAAVRARLLDAHQRRGRALIDYLLLPREIHVVSQVTAEDSPGRVARAIGNVVARWVRQLQPVRSPVFAGPYRALQLHDDEELRRTARLLAWRPVVLGLCATPIHYPYSALRTTLGLRLAQGFDARPLLRLFGENVPLARAALRKWLAGRPSDCAVRQWELLCGLALATGTMGPRALVSRPVWQPATAQLVAAAGHEGVDGALRLLELWVGARVAAGHPLDFHASHDARGARARALVACLAVDHGLCSAASVARHFHRAKATLSEQMSLSRKRGPDRAILDKPLPAIVEEALSLHRVEVPAQDHARRVLAPESKDPRRRAPSGVCDFDATGACAASGSC